ncbi:MAG: hypothetical protein JWN95_3264 [Frankiales bacterium]|nr:hypothetical protein [Frankiales bacterium]
MWHVVRCSPRAGLVLLIVALGIGLVLVPTTAGAAGPTEASRAGAGARNDAFLHSGYPLVALCFAVPLVLSLATYMIMSRLTRRLRAGP